MAKAAEYELLSPYHGTLNIGTLIRQIEDLVAAGDPTWLDDPVNFKQLTELYYSDFHDLAAQVWGRMISRPPRLNGSAQYALTREEIAALNQDGRVIINLGEKGMIGPTEENARLLEIRVAQMQAYSSREIDAGELDLIFEHSGISTMQFDGRSYGFHHYRSSADPPITWGSDYDLVAKGEPKPENVAKSEVAMLRYLLGTNAPADDSNLYAHAGAWADIVVRKEIKPGDIPVVIQAVTIEAKYEFNRVRERSVLEVSSSHGMPLVTLDIADLDEKRDGRGTFRRVYQKDVTVKLTAQDPYASLRFKEWREGDASLSTDPQVSVTLSSGRQLEAVYGP
jgi:hypothetical protein